MDKDIMRIIGESAETIGNMKKLAGRINKVAEIIIDAYKKGGKVIIFGNGGSAGQAQHIATELVHRFEKDRKAIPAIALTTDTSCITAIGNDWGFEQVFERQVEALATPRDVVIGMSTSGNSANVIKAIAKANEIGCRTIALTGRDGGKIKELADMTIIVPNSNTARIQEAHLVIGHIICKIVEDSL